MGASTPAAAPSGPASQQRHPNVAKEGNGTRGLSLRELVLELRKDVKEIKQGLGKRPTRTELYGTIAAVLSIVVGISVLF